MESVALIFNSITMMFILMVIGYILKKAAIITDSGIKDITDLLLYFVIPSIIVNSFAESYSEEKAQSIIICFILAICIHLLFGFMSNFIFKDPIDKNAAILCIFTGTASNTGIKTAKTSGDLPAFRERGRSVFLHEFVLRRFKKQNFK